MKIYIPCEKNSVSSTKLIRIEVLDCQLDVDYKNVELSKYK